MVAEAFDLDGVLKIRTEMAVDEYDQEKVDEFAAEWRERMNDKRRERDLHLVP